MQLLQFRYPMKALIWQAIQSSSEPGNYCALEDLKRYNQLAPQDEVVIAHFPINENITEFYILRKLKNPPCVASDLEVMANHETLTDLLDETVGKKSELEAYLKNPIEMQDIKEMVCSLGYARVR